MHNRELTDKQTYDINISDVPKIYKNGIGDNVLNLIELNNLKKEFEDMDSTNIDSIKLIQINEKLNKMIKK